MEHIPELEAKKPQPLVHRLGWADSWFASPAWKLILLSYLGKRHRNEESDHNEDLNYKDAELMASTAAVGAISGQSEARVMPRGSRCNEACTDFWKLDLLQGKQPLLVSKLWFEQSQLRAYIRCCSSAVSHTYTSGTVCAISHRCLSVNLQQFKDFTVFKSSMINDISCQHSWWL